MIPEGVYIDIYTQNNQTSRGQLMLEDHPMLIFTCERVSSSRNLRFVVTQASTLRGDAYSEHNEGSCAIPPLLAACFLKAFPALREEKV